MQTFFEGFVLVVIAALIAGLVLQRRDLGLDWAQTLSLGTSLVFVAMVLAHRIQRVQEATEEWRLARSDPWARSSPPPSRPKSSHLNRIEWIMLLIAALLLLAFLGLHLYDQRKQSPSCLRLGTPTSRP